MQRSCKEISYKDLAKTCFIVSLHKHCQEISDGDLLQGSCREISCEDLVKRSVAEFLQRYGEPEQRCYFETFSRDLLWRPLLESSCRGLAYRELAWKSLVEILARDIL